jgi:hypothetical protein
VAVLQHPLGAKAGGLHLLGERRARTFGGEPPVEPGQLGAELAIGVVPAAAPAAGAWPKPCAMPTQAASLPGAAIATGVTSAASLAALARPRPAGSARPVSTSAPTVSLSQLLISWVRRCCRRRVARLPASTRWMPSLRRAEVQLRPPRSMPRTIRSIRIASTSPELLVSPHS